VKHKAFILKFLEAFLSVKSTSKEPTYYLHM